ncbi:MAG TPA: TM0106 family RecB-like putative nuclease [Acidimicrobiales bacterium]|nr:TM0106 family RecB-like putative nuclease [Acidimicrobiales bacterium]
MHRGDDGTLILSPTDLVGHLACEHLTTLEQLRAAGGTERPEPRPDDLREVDVLRRRGEEHEAAELARLEALGLRIARIDPAPPTVAGLRRAEARTAAAMAEGVDVVFQASFFDGRWRGQADFLHRVPGETALGPWGYEVVDTKLARRAKPDALLQMCSYTEHVTRIQGVAPETMAVVTGDGGLHRFRVADAMAYFRAARSRLEAALAAGATGDATYPLRVDHCRGCPWDHRCDEQRRADDHLSLVAGMRRDMLPKLASEGITTVAELAASPLGAPVRRMGLATVDRLRHQARLQLLQRADGRVRHELVEAGRDPAADDDADVAPSGLSWLPEPSPGDVFFDIEGDPWVGEDGLEYLFGLVLDAPEGDDACFVPVWAHSHLEEKRAFEAVVDLLVARLDAHPDMHVYHYAPYEVTALRTLMGRHATRGAELDRLLRAEVFVDLYRVVRHSVRVSQEGYGLKKLEPLYLGQREGAITDGGSSIVEYERFLSTGDEAILADIEAYNRVDCESTLGLRDWLEERRGELEALRGRPLPRPAPREGEPSADQAAAEAATAALASGLLHGVPEEPHERDAAEAGLALLSGLVDHHRREARPAWWWHFERLERTPEELVDDHDSIGSLRPEGEVGRVARSVVHRYCFDPRQEHKLRVGDAPLDPATGRGAGTVEALDAASGTVDLRRSATSVAPHPRALIPPRPLDDKVMRQAIGVLGTWVVEHGLDSDRPEHRAARDLLLRRPPRVRGHEAGTALVPPDEDPSAAARRLVPLLDGAVLAIQGPPGSGKTWIGAALVVDAVRAGRRVGVAANSHKAISNLLMAVGARADADGVGLRAVQRCPEGQVADDPHVTRAGSADDVLDALADGARVAAGTAWLFARPEMAGAVDLLVVDEASQVSLANVVAMAGTADDVVLLGDPQQLPQVSQGTHPSGAGASALEHVLAGRRTVAPEQGLFLDTTWRMHPEVCGFVSEVAYGGRLRPHPSTACQVVADGPLLGGAGIRFHPVTHEGNRTRSPEEADVVSALVTSLLGRPWTAADGTTRPLTLDDLLVIAPFNAQVACLVEALPSGARVGTVDRFQGQEAPVVLYSLAASSAVDVPRGIEFLYNLNRLNVAISRARSLAVVVANPRLLAARCHSPQQLRLVNALCRLVEVATPVA